MNLSMALPLLAGLVTTLVSGCASEPAGLASSATVRVSFLAPSTVRTLVLEVSGPGIDPAVILNIPVSPDSTASESIVVSAGSARRFVVTALDTTGVPSHRADTTLSLMTGTQPELVLRLRPLSTQLGITVTFGNSGTLAVIESPGNGVAGDVLTPVVVEVRNTSGLRDTTFNGFVSLEFAENPTGAWLLGDTAIRAIRGRATFASIGVGLPGNGYRLRAKAGTRVPALTESFSTVNPSVPVDETSLAASAYGFCALSSSGQAECWGKNTFGGLGTGDLTDRTVPTPVSGGIAFRSIALGNGHACGVTPAGQAYCWGRNAFGALGDGTNVNSSVPVPVQGELNLHRIDVGTITSCGLTSVGEAYCWGYNNSRLGTGDSTHRAVPTPVSARVRFTSLTVGAFGGCGVTAGGWAYCWGIDGGRFGLGDLPEYLLPVRLSRTLRFSQLVLADLAVSQPLLTCAVTVARDVYCWGNGVRGQFGNGALGSSVTPVRAMTGLTPKELVVTEVRVCALDALQRAYCWGQNEGAIGDGTVEDRSLPTLVAGNLQFSDIATSARSSCGIATTGALYCWGTEFLGDGGIAPSQTTPALVPGGGLYRVKP